MMNKIVFCEDGVFNDGVMSDLDVLVDVLLSEVKMCNWWVVGEEGVKVDCVIDCISKKIKEELESVGFKENWMSCDYSLEFESCNIMSSEYSIMMLSDESLKEFNDKWVDGEYEYDGLIIKEGYFEDESVVLNEMDFCGKEKEFERIIEIFNEDESVVLRKIVDSCR